MKIYLLILKIALGLSISIMVLSLAVLIDLKPKHLERHVLIFGTEFILTIFLLINIVRFQKKRNIDEFDFILPYVNGFNYFKLYLRRTIGFFSTMILIGSLTFFFWHNIFVWVNFKEGFFLKQYRTVEFYYPLGLTILFLLTYLSYGFLYISKRNALRK